MGFAHGKLQSEKAKSMMNAVWSYLEEQVVSDHYMKSTVHGYHKIWMSKIHR